MSKTATISNISKFLSVLNDTTLRGKSSRHESRLSAYDSIETACRTPNLLERFDINRDLHCISMQCNVSEMCPLKFTFAMNARRVINGDTTISNCRNAMP